MIIGFSARAIITLAVVVLMALVPSHANERKVTRRNLGFFADQSAGFLSPFEPRSKDFITLTFRTPTDFRGSITVYWRVAQERFRWFGGWRSDALVFSRADKFRFYLTTIDTSLVKGLVDGRSIEYYFQIEESGKRFYYSARGLTRVRESPFRIHLGLTTPDWVKHGIIYQVFLDRFSDGNPSNNVNSGEYCFGKVWKGRRAGEDACVYTHREWEHFPDNSYMPDLDSRYPGDSQDAGTGHHTYASGVDFFGGDLAGLRNKLDYIQKLGATIISLNPIFVAPSNHKYDTSNYNNIDSHFGTDAEFKELVEEIHRRGMKIILDGVFNHTGSMHGWLQKAQAEISAGNYKLTSDGVATNNSYVEFYTFADRDHDGVVSSADYYSWRGYSSLPKLNFDASVVLGSGRRLNPTRLWLYGDDQADATFDAEVQELLDTPRPVALYWMERFGIDGWRLDVPDEAGGRRFGEPASADFALWQRFRSAIKRSNPDAYLVGEIWSGSRKWLDVGSFDGLMNYEGFSDPLSLFINGQDTNALFTAFRYVAKAEFKASDLLRVLEFKRNRISGPQQYAMLNLIGSHDTPRFLRRTKEDGILQTRFWGKLGRWNKNFFDEGAENVNRLKLAFLIQMTYVGPPSIYYGDEVGLSGADDPDNRRTFPWNKMNHGLLKYVQVLTHFRHQYEALRIGSFQAIFEDDDRRTLAFTRFTPNQRLIVIVNAGVKSNEVVLRDLKEVAGITDGALLTDLFSNSHARPAAAHPFARKSS